MRRFRFAFVVVSVFSVLVSAAAFADSMGAAPAASGWLKADMIGAWPSQISMDAQKVVGQNADQLKTDMGPTSLMTPDGHGGTYYFYSVQTESASGGPNAADEWFDVASNGTVTGAVVNVN
jgi:hypothetical protein